VNNNSKVYLRLTPFNISWINLFRRGVSVNLAQFINVLFTHLFIYLLSLQKLTAA